MNKTTILVVEDDRPIRNLIGTTLKTHDYKYLTAENGTEAILEASSHNPDIILLPTGEKISRVRTNEQITAINGVAEGFITFYNNRLTAVIVPIDKSASEDIFKRRIDKYNEKKVYLWEIQKIVLRKEPLPRNSDGTVDEEAVCELIGD